MYRVVLVCSGIPESSGAEAASDITAEFQQQRTWHSNAFCTWDGALLTLQADNDFDRDGLALADEFSDAVSAYVSGQFHYEIHVESVTEVPGVP
jgi:hypothetical protein